MLGLRYVYVLALVVWLGGMIVLAGIAAPAAFQVLQGRVPASGRVLAGAVVGEMLRRFQLVTFVSGAALVLSLVLMAVLGPRPRGLARRLAIIGVMLASTVYAGVVVAGQIERIQHEVSRDTGTSINSLPPDDPRRARFGRLHGLSNVLMLVNIAGGLVLLVWEAQE